MNQRISFYLIIIILFNQVLSQNFEQIMDDSQKCIAHQDKNTCSSVKLTSGIYQCCKLFQYVYNPSYPFSNSICSIQINPIKAFNEEMEKETTKALFKEIWGYALYNMGAGSNMKMEMTYTCKDGTASMKFGFDTYTDEEKEILRSENHCMRYIYGINDFTTKEECFNSVILPSSKNVGLSCGYFEFNIKYSDGTSENFKSCNIFNKDVITNGHLDDKTKETLQTFVNNNADDEKIVLSYVVDFSDDKGHKVVYDSITQSIKSSGKMLSLVKYLFYITLLLIL